MSVLHPDGDDAERRSIIGVDHVGYTYASLTELLENYARLRDEGIRPYWCVHHGITASMYFADPDGNQMEFQVDSLASGDEAAEAWSAVFRVVLDAEEVRVPVGRHELRAGTAESDLLVRKVHEPESPLRG